MFRTRNPWFHSFYYFTLLKVEVRGKLSPDARYDSVLCAFCCIQEEDPSMILLPNSRVANCQLEIIGMFPDKFSASFCGLSLNGETNWIGLESYWFYEGAIHNVTSEKELILALVDRVLLFDPDILVSFEAHRHSWGYLIERAHAAYGLHRHVI